jgi:tight adherence protein B
MHAIVLSKTILLPVIVFGAVFAFLFALLLVVSRRTSYRGSVESRLHGSVLPKIKSQEELITIRRSRSLSPEGHYMLPAISLNKLVLQSGASLGLPGLFAIMAGIAAIAFLAAEAAALGHALSALISAIAGIALPLSVLRSMRDRRQSKFEEQIPDALDTVVRSLKAGHALSVAIASVGRNMPDPAGAEFRLAEAEVAYGLDLETAMVNLSSRVGQPDLALVVLAVSIQSRTGGNLAEILGNLARVVRARLKLRRRAYALSAEGRFSAILLSLLPIAIFGVLCLISPNYYGEVWANPYVKPVLAGSVAWMLTGDYVMYRMVRIRI